ncbi:DUF6545 domain-containing protein [Streptomyces malaysiensis]|uniref:DUF6545 domain-containing protein n=1 Tax=Streptomyces malaysiensis subsp. samsunensis TaxID=459658 RepID=A0A9X2LYX1_STRMQ|nr:DUF6545 domain-containing protein [Streptomyces samsunensis]MCQ8832134.1 hypothetical protein [Streptomyces samsunensis]
MVQPESARVRQALRPRAPLALQAHRRTIETYDAIPDLQAWGQPGPYERARTYAQQIGVSGEQLEATVLAGALWQARRAKLAGDEKQAEPGGLPGIKNGSTQLLRAIARACPGRPMPSRASPSPGISPVPRHAVGDRRGQKAQEKHDHGSDHRR